MALLFANLLQERRPALAPDSGPRAARAQMLRSRIAPVGQLRSQAMSRVHS